MKRDSVILLAGIEFSTTIMENSVNISLKMDQADDPDDLKEIKSLSQIYPHAGAYCPIMMTVTTE